MTSVAFMSNEFRILYGQRKCLLQVTTFVGMTILIEVENLAKTPIRKLTHQAFKRGSLPSCFNNETRCSSHTRVILQKFISLKKHVRDIQIAIAEILLLEQQNQSKILFNHRSPLQVGRWVVLSVYKGGPKILVIFWFTTTLLHFRKMYHMCQDDIFSTYLRPSIEFKIIVHI